jgi:DNA invertase Pin-like site-specific DNA recombinase
MSTKKKASATGVRYTDAQKQEVVDFVAQYNSANGRGGQSAASSKFKVTPLTISTWIKNLGKPAAKPAKAAKAVKPAKAVKAAKPAKAAKAPKASKAKASKKGVRYTPEQKKEVVDFVASYNEANGRGGQSQAAKKFSLSVLTVSAWLKALGGKKKGAKAVKAAKPAKAAKAVKPAKAAKSSSAGSSELEALKAAIRKLVN